MEASSFSNALILSLMAEGIRAANATLDADGWIEVCAAADLGKSDVIRFDHGRKTYALCRDEYGALFATDGICTHGNNHLADGLVIQRHD